jgi:hypothetical protein
MEDALQDLISKMKDWSSNYHGEVRKRTSMTALYNRVFASNSYVHQVVLYEY